MEINIPKGRLLDACSNFDDRDACASIVQSSLVVSVQAPFVNTETRAMNHSNSIHIRKCVKELAELLNPDSEPSTNVEIDRAIRLLRPAKGSTEHSTAIRARIRQTILNQSAESNSDGQLLLNKFEKQCEAVRKVNPSILNPFLAVLQPLSFKAEKKQNNTQSKHFSNLAERKSNGDGAFSDNVGTASFNSEAKAVALGQSTEEQAVVDSMVVQSDLVWVSSEVEHLLLVDLIYVLQVCAVHMVFHCSVC